MDEYIYGSTSYEDRRIIDESDKQMGEPMEEEEEEEDEDDETATDGRRRRRVVCRCGARTRRRTRRIISQNPFIIFFLEMYSKMPEKHVTEVARQAGKEWSALSEEEKKKYVLLAERERRRRQRRGITRRRRRRTIS